MRHPHRYVQYVAIIKFRLKLNDIPNILVLF